MPHAHVPHGLKSSVTSTYPSLTSPLPMADGRCQPRAAIFVPSASASLILGQAEIEDVVEARAAAEHEHRSSSWSAEKVSIMKVALWALSASEAEAG